MGEIRCKEKRKLRSLEAWQIGTWNPYSFMHLGKPFNLSPIQSFNQIASPLSLKPTRSRTFGFTLSEILITLGILGVVAAFTIPSLMRKTQDMEYKSAAKKAFSVSAQVVTQMRAENGGNLDNYFATTDSFKPVFMTYFKVLKDCGNNDGCVATTTSSNIYSSLHGDKGNTTMGGEGQFVTSDGMFFNIQNIGNNVAGICIIVDVNGYEKKPNKYGQDTFAFQIVNDTLVPMGSLGTYRPFGNSESCSRSTSAALQGIGCMYNLMNNLDY